MTPNLIGMGGLLRAGKDCVADYLVEEYGYVKLFMSKPLLDMFLTLNPIVPSSSEHGAEIATRKEISLPPYVRASVLFEALDEDYTELKTNREVRRFLQVLGTDVGRNMIDPNLWVNKAREYILEEQAQGHNVVITGMRFPNELAMVNELGGVNAWVERASVRTAATHASETSVQPEDFDVLLTNNGTLNDLYWLVDEWMKKRAGEEIA